LAGSESETFKIDSSPLASLDGDLILYIFALVLTQTRERKSMNKLAPLFVIIAASLWGLDGIVFQPALSNLPVPLVVFIECWTVAIFLSPILFTRFSELKNLELWDWIAFFCVALLGGALGTMSITKALFYVNFVNLSIVILIQKLQPVFALLLAALILKEKLPRIFFIWAILAVIGAYFMTFGFGSPDFNTGDKTWIAAAFSLVAAVSFGSSTVFSKRALKNTGFAMGTYLRFLISGIIMMLIAGTAGNLNSIIKVSQFQWLIFLLIAFTTGGAAIFLYYYGLKKITASVATICELAFPMTAVILEYFIHGNILKPVQWTGVAILLFSIYRVSKINHAEVKDKRLKD
jgi:drug/metabolite transporter (DMT)-like permease